MQHISERFTDEPAVGREQKLEEDSISLLVRTGMRMGGGCRIGWEGEAKRDDTAEKDKQGEIGGYRLGQLSFQEQNTCWLVSPKSMRSTFSPPLGRSSMHLTPKCTQRVPSSRRRRDAGTLVHVYIDTCYERRTQQLITRLWSSVVARMRNKG